MNDKLRKALLGISVRQEFLCLSLEDFRNPLSVHVSRRNSDEVFDVTAGHLFLGYKPLILAIAAAAMPGGRALTDAEVCLSFNSDGFVPDADWRGFPSSRNSVARLHMRKLDRSEFRELPVSLYLGEYGQHRFINHVHQAINGFIERHRRRPAGNVALDGNLHDQVRIAYSVPRIIALVAVADRQLMNVFPTDLHGPVGADGYLSSLRVGGKACSQVESSRRLLVAEVDSGIHKAVYRLGKNHMKNMLAASAFELDSSISATFGIPLPAGAVKYRELEWDRFTQVGIHRIYYYRVVHEAAVGQSRRLAHVHQYYAQWRESRGLKTEYLLR
jgi:hypothetical protein